MSLTVGLSRERVNDVLSSPVIALEPGTRVDVYRLIRPLGKGGFAEVWEAKNEADGRHVALKVLTELRADSERALERFEQEGRLAASLSSPRCVYVFGAGAVEGCPYIAMELMTGGTLAGRIESGSLDARSAVDCVLDVLEGLEAAQRQGILHRDVKPTNVFLDAEGRAKIGDFGISKSLEGDAKLTQTGAFLGTPYYASPEQIAAEPLDLRSDLYSVGAMLYELLTGKLPYAGTNASQVLAQVLTRDPVPFAQTGVAVPLGLQQVVMRLLAKQREKRFQSYPDTRDALLPFSSRGLVVAPLPRRFGAILIDLALFFPLSFMVGAFLLQRDFRAQMPVSLSVHVLELAYFTLLERYGGASLGKRILGLRVTTVDGGSPAMPRVLVRSLIFLLLLVGPSIGVQQLAAAGVPIGSGPLVTWMPALFELLGVALLVSPMRKANGYAGTHELITHTRVMALAGRERASTVAPVTAAAMSGAAGQEFGPYRATGVLWSRDGESLMLARDAALGRDVWVHVAGEGGLPPLEVVRERGEGSLPWLQRGSSEGAVWDAYGAPAGTALGSEGRLDWGQMRGVLHSVAAELSDRFKRQGTAGPLSPDCVWVDPGSRALLLDFPVTPGGAPALEVTPANWWTFLGMVATRGLRWPSVPLPEHGRALLAKLAIPTGPGPIDEFVAALDRVADRPTRVTRLRRLGPLAMFAILPVLMVAVSLVVPVFMKGLPTWYQDLSLNAEPLIDSLRSTTARAGTDSVAARTARAIQVVLARDRYEAGLTPQLGKPALNALPPRARAEVDSAALRYPSPDARMVADARAWLATRVPARHLHSGPATSFRMFVTAFGITGYLGILGVLLAAALRGGLLFTLFGIALQQADGTPASRLRCLSRSLVAWAPLLLLAVLSEVSNVSVTPPRPGVTVSATSAPSEPSAPRSDVIDDLLVLVAIGGAGFAVWRPTQGIAERVAGVVLVPK